MTIWKKKKKKDKLSVWGWHSHPQFGLQNLVKVEQPWLFGELTACQTGSQPSTTTCYFDNCGFRATRAICKAPSTYRKLQGSKCPSCSHQETPGHSSPNGAARFRGTTSTWVSAIIPVVPRVIQKTSSKKVSETQHWASLMVESFLLSLKAFKIKREKHITCVKAQLNKFPSPSYLCNFLPI